MPQRLPRFERELERAADKQKLPDYLCTWFTEESDFADRKEIVVLVPR